MKLKEAYRYSNCLNTMYMTLLELLKMDSVVMNTAEYHMRSQADPNAIDEEIVVPKNDITEAKPNVIINAAADIVKEREELSKAINIAKRTADIDIDEALAMNKWKRSVINVLESLAHRRNGEVIQTATGYKLDAEGKQTPYVYNKKVVRTIDYDRNEVRKLLNKYQTECDQVSSMVDGIEINTDVDFEPQFDIHASLEDILAEYTA